MHDDDDEYDDDEVDAIVTASIAELLNIAASVAELQMNDSAADDIYAICDVVAEYYQIERAVAVIEEHDDGSFTTRYETFIGAAPPEPEPKQRSGPLTGSIRTVGKPKLRVSDSSPPPAEAAKTARKPKPKAPPESP